MPMLFLRGILIGLIFGVPAGAIGVLTIQRTLDRGFTAGLLTGLGSSAADLLYSCVGVFGITLISDFLTAHQSVIRIIGGVLISGYGALNLRKKERPPANAHTGGAPIKCFVSSFVIAILNPATILSFMVAFAAFGITGKLALVEGVSLTLGVLIGTVLWWLTLSAVTVHFREKVTDRLYKRLRLLLGGLMILFGIIMIAESVIR